MATMLFGDRWWLHYHSERWEMYRTVESSNCTSETDIILC